MWGLRELVSIGVIPLSKERKGESLGGGGLTDTIFESVRGRGGRKILMEKRGHGLRGGKRMRKPSWGERGFPKKKSCALEPKPNSFGKGKEC